MGGAMSGMRARADIEGDPPTESNLVDRPEDARDLADHLAPLRPAKVVLDQSGNVGAALGAARRALDLSADDIALATRVPASHIASIEAFDLEKLPARPFTIGYVRAYARALGLDAEAVVARFRMEAPDADTALRPPAGLTHAVSRRFLWIGLAAAVVALAVTAWNVVRQTTAVQSRTHVAAGAPRPRIAQRQSADPAHLGAPPPPPPEATTPPAYETPGLSAAMAAKAAAGSATPAAPPPPKPVAEGPAVGAPFIAAGVIYGAPPPGSGVILQARKPTALIVHGPGGVVYFARQLAAGEAWRAPDMPGLTLDVGNPAAVEVFAHGVSRGPLTDPKAAVSHLGD
jgi:cytoskeleton protein RodZ